MEREPKLSNQKNWLNRYVIFMSSLDSQDDFNEKHTQFLEPVKKYYYQEFLNDIGNYEVPDDIQDLVKENISYLLNNITKQQLGLRESMNQVISKMSSKHSQFSSKQLQNQVFSELCIGSEEIIRETVRSYSINDSLSKTKLGRFVRKFIPSESQRKMNKIVNHSNKLIQDITNDFMVDQIRKK